MSYEPQLNAEIFAELEDLAKRGRAWRAEFIAHEIVGRHVDGLSGKKHKEFWRHCGYSHVRDAVRRCINVRAGDRQDDTDKDQFRLPGYDHVHSYYLVKRGGDDIAVPVHDLTDEEIDKKANLYREMGRACFEHADELQRFKRERMQAAA